MQIETILHSLPLGVLPFMLLLPLFGALIAYLAGDRLSRPVAVTVGLIELVLSLLLAVTFDPIVTEGDPLVGMRETWTYVMGNVYPGTSIELRVGVDGISVVMVVLANLVVFVALLSSNHINKSQKFFYALMLILQTGLDGVFMSINLLGFFIFWELVLIPMFFVIGQWGEEGAQHAAVKFFIYTQLGSLAMLVGFFALFVVGGTFDMIALRNLDLDPLVGIGFAVAVFLGAGVKLPVWPLHNWLPYAHVKAPTPGSVILAGILLKMGGYAFVRLGLWLNADAFLRLSIPFAILAVFTCIYAAFTAMAQTDLKSMVAYTSINHMSWVLLGVAANTELAIQGAVFMMFSHGVIISVLFIVAGLLKYSAGSRQIPDVQGLMKGAPRLSAVFVLASMAAFGLPSFSGFIAEALILFGSVQVYIWAGAIAFGIFVTVGYFLWTLNRVVFSPPSEKQMHDASAADLIGPAIMMFAALVLGLWPDLILRLLNNVVEVVFLSLAGG